MTTNQSVHGRGGRKREAAVSVKMYMLEEGDEEEEEEEGRHAATGGRRASKSAMFC